MLAPATDWRSVCEDELQIVRLVAGLEELLRVLRRRAGGRCIVDVVDSRGKRVVLGLWVV